MRLDNLPDDDQPQAEGRLPGRAGAFSLVFEGEQLGFQVFGDTYALVRHRYHGQAVFPERPEVDVRIRGAEFYGVAQEVDDDPPDLLLIDDQVDGFRLQADDLLFFAGLEPESADAGFQQRGQGYLFFLQGAERQVQPHDLAPQLEGLPGRLFDQGQQRHGLLVEVGVLVQQGDGRLNGAHRAAHVGGDHPQRVQVG